MTHAECLAAFVAGASYEDISETARQQLKIRILDSLGCAIGAVEGEPTRRVREQVDEFGGAGKCTLLGGGHSAPDRATLYNAALVRYLDFADNYLAKGKICHPSDNLAPILAACEYAGASGKDLLTSLALAYQVQCRLTDHVPVTCSRFDQTTQLAYSVAAGVSRALGLDPGRIVNALGIAGSSCMSLGVTRTGPVSQWKGLASAHTATSALCATFLAMRGVTGPAAVFEGPNGLLQALGCSFEVEWAGEPLDRVTHTSLKKYQAQIYAQSVIDAIIELRTNRKLQAEDVEQIEIETFDAAYEAIGGGGFGERKLVTTREQADHSLPYVAAIALLDSQVGPEQYRPQQISRPDVQDLLRRVKVQPDRNYSRYYPAELCCQVTITLRDGQKMTCQKDSYEGFYTHPMPREQVVEKFQRLAEPYTDAKLRDEIISAVFGLENIAATDLGHLLGRVQLPNYKQPAEPAPQPAPAIPAEAGKPWQEVPVNLLHA